MVGSGGINWRVIGSGGRTRFLALRGEFGLGQFHLNNITALNPTVKISYMIKIYQIYCFSTSSSFIRSFKDRKFLFYISSSRMDLFSSVCRSSMSAIDLLMSFNDSIVSLASWIFNSNLMSSYRLWESYFSNFLFYSTISSLSLSWFFIKFYTYFMWFCLLCSIFSMFFNFSSKTRKFRFALSASFSFYLYCN